MVSTQGLAAASARHPWRTIGAWAVAALLAMIAIGALLGGSLTTEGRPTNDPQSFRAEAYTLGLQNAFPSILALGRELISIPGSPPDLAAPPLGCGFADRCPFALEACRVKRPPQVAIGQDRLSACIRTADIEHRIRSAAVKKATWHC